MPDIIPLEELEEALLEKQTRQESILSEVNSLFSDADFKRSDEPNTITFSSSKKDIKASFSIDNTTYNYTSYITTEGENSSNYSIKGNIDGLVDAAFKFVEEYADLTDGFDDGITVNDVEDVGHEVDED